jgi:hypothetical protein
MSHLHGAGDEWKALLILAFAAEQGSPPAQNNLAFALERSKTFDLPERFPHILLELCPSYASQQAWQHASLLGPCISAGRDPWCGSVPYSRKKICLNESLVCSLCWQGHSEAWNCAWLVRL